MAARVNRFQAWFVLWDSPCIFLWTSLAQGSFSLLGSCSLQELRPPATCWFGMQKHQMASLSYRPSHHFNNLHSEVSKWCTHPQIQAYTLIHSDVHREIHILTVIKLKHHCKVASHLDERCSFDLIVNYAITDQEFCFVKRTWTIPSAPDWPRVGVTNNKNRVAAYFREASSQTHKIRCGSLSGKPPID